MALHVFVPGATNLSHAEMKLSEIRLPLHQPAARAYPLLAFYSSDTAAILEGALIRVSVG